MLRITMNKSAAGAKKYYCELYYQEGHSAQFDYYGEGTELIGRWGGKGAQQLGLRGSIDKKAFARMCDNITPFTGKKLTSRNDTDRTVGYDFTFNASKSVSLAYAFASDAEKKIILDAFQTAVRETMGDVESGMQARVRGKGKNENRLTGNLAYGEFTHFTTRPIDGVPDPHLHSHCFVFNATFDGEENKWKAGQFRQIKQDAPYYEAIFHSKLAQHLQLAGYGVTRNKLGFELAGLHKQTLDKFSRRTQEIEEYAHEHGITSETQKSMVGAKTREAKRAAVSKEKEAAAWLSCLTIDEQAAINQLRSKPIIADNDDAANKSVALSLAHHLERKSVASDKEILATAIKGAIGQASPERVRAAFRAKENILLVTEALRTYVTTKEALREEKQLIHQAMLSRNKFRPIYQDYKIENPMLNQQQQAAVLHAMRSTNGIIVITGKAGTGKTTLMTEVKLGIEAVGRQIFSFAPSSEASRSVQRSEGFANANTVASLIQQTNEHASFKNQVLWIDEAGMLSNKDMNHILAIANAQGARIILSGDTKQHSSVERGDALRTLLHESGIMPVTVDKIQRQQTTAYKEAVQLLSEGWIEQGFKKLDRMGAIHEMTDSASRLEAIAEDYTKSVYGSGPQHKNVLVVAPTHAEGDIVTEKIREKLKEQELIGQVDHVFEVLKNKQYTDAEKQCAENYEIGDVVAFHQNAKGIKAGNNFTVFDTNESSVVGLDANGLHWPIPLLESKKFSVFEKYDVGITEGDKIRITSNGQSEEGTHLFNGSVFKVKRFNENGDLQLSNNSTLPADFGHFTLGYVSTSHASQGKTADKVIISQSSATFRASSIEQFYVSVSRGREDVSIYTDDKEHLLDAVSQSSERTSATALEAKRLEQNQEQLRAASLLALNEKRQENLSPSTNNINYGLQATARTKQNAIGR